MSTQAKLPAWFWVITVGAIIWTLVGVASYITDVTMSDEALGALPVEQREIYEARPAWVVGVYAIAVFSALIGAVMLALRKSLATPFLGASLAAVIVQFGFVLFGMNAIATLGASAAIFPGVIVIIGAFMLWFSMQAKTRGWLK